ncbi:MAG: MerR family transcriptional regulator [Minicystis sp.]
MGRTFTLADLVREANIGRRTLASYIRRGALPKTKLRGPLPAYDEAFLTRLKAVIRLRREGVRIDDIGARLEHATAAEIAYLAGEGPAPQQPAPATPAPATAITATAGDGFDRWERCTLYPGLELHVAAGADEAAQRMARAIRTMFGPQGP